MRTYTTLLSPRVLAERDVAEFLERRFDSGWLPEYHSVSIDSPDGTVVVRFDPDYADRLGEDERNAVATRVGFVPRTAMHVEMSIYHAGSADLAGRVSAALSAAFDGRRAAA